MKVLWSWGCTCPRWALQLDLANKGCFLGNSSLKIIPLASADLFLKLVTKKTTVPKIINKKMPHLTNKGDSNQKLGVWGLAGVKVRKTPLDSVPVEDSDQPFPMVWCAGMKCSQRCWHKATPRWPPHASLGVWHILDLANHDREVLPVGTLSLVSPLLHPVLTTGPSEVVLATHWLFLPTQTCRA